MKPYFVKHFGYNMAIEHWNVLGCHFHNGWCKNVHHCQFPSNQSVFLQPDRIRNIKRTAINKLLLCLSKYGVNILLNNLLLFPHRFFLLFSK